MPYTKMLENTHKTTARGMQHFPQNTCVLSALGQLL